MQERHYRIFGSKESTTKTFEDPSNDIELWSTEIRGVGFTDSNDSYHHPGMYRLRAKDVMEVVEELKEQIKEQLKKQIEEENPKINLQRFKELRKVTELKKKDIRFIKNSAHFGRIFKIILEGDYSLADIYPYEPKEYVPLDADWEAEWVGNRQDNNRRQDNTKRYYPRVFGRKEKIELGKFDLNIDYLYGGNKRKYRKKKTTRKHKKKKKTTRKRRKKKKAKRKNRKKRTYKKIK